MIRTLKVAILVYHDVEVLDFAGPFEVFSVASRVALRDGDADLPLFEPYLCAHSKDPVQARGGMTIIPQSVISNELLPDLLIVPGGVVAEPFEVRELVSWIANAHRTTLVTASVCTGAFLLARAGLLVGRVATTHWEDVVDLQAVAPDTIIRNDVRYVDEGRIVTSAGVSSGIEMSLHLVARLATPDLAARTARQIEYHLS